MEEELEIDWEFEHDAILKEKHVLKKKLDSMTNAYQNEELENRELKKQLKLYKDEVKARIPFESLDIVACQNGDGYTVYESNDLEAMIDYYRTNNFDLQKDIHALKKELAVEKAVSGELDKEGKKELYLKALGIGFLSGTLVNLFLQLFL